MTPLDALQTAATLLTLDAVLKDIQRDAHGRFKGDGRKRSANRRWEDYMGWDAKPPKVGHKRDLYAETKRKWSTDRWVRT